MDLTIWNPLPKDKPNPECPCISVWTENYVSTHHFKIPLLLALRVSKSLSVPLMYHIICTNLSQSSSPGTRTLVSRNAMDVQVSVLALLVAYRVFDC